MNKSTSKHALLFLSAATLAGTAGLARASINNWNFANTTFNQSDANAGPTVAPESYI